MYNMAKTFARDRTTQALVIAKARHVYKKKNVGGVRTAKRAWSRPEGGGADF